VPQEVVQMRTVTPAVHVHPSSETPSQSTSRPLQVSDGGTQDPQTQELSQVLIPREPQEVVHEEVSPTEQS